MRNSRVCVQNHPNVTALGKFYSLGFSFFLVFNSFILLCVRMCADAMGEGVRFLELELQAVVYHRTCVLGI